MVLQCPRCPLRFDLAPMLADHMSKDHDIGPEVTDHLQPPSRRVGIVKPKDAPDSESR
ncbi:MAG: hypothetical protein ACR2HR_15125 [Euzebya sp.]